LILARLELGSPSRAGKPGTRLRVAGLGPDCRCLLPLLAATPSHHHSNFLFISGSFPL